MNSKVIKLLVSVCIGLCLVIAGEWLYASYMRHSLLTSISSAKTQDYKTDTLPQIDLSKQPEDSYVDLVARPLFIKGRRPVNEPSLETAQTVTKPESFDWQLNGIYSTKTTVSALFSRAASKVAKDNHRKITVGDDLDGWKLTGIGKDRVMLKKGSKEKELLLRKPKLKQLPQGTKPEMPVAPNHAPAPEVIPEPPADTTEDTSEGNQ
jgi:hypothetical protein